MDLKQQGKLSAGAGLALSLASAVLPALPGCLSSQRAYVGAAERVHRNLTYRVSYREEGIFSSIPLKGILTVESPDGSVTVYHDDNCDGSVDGLDRYGPSNSKSRHPNGQGMPGVPPDERPMVSRRWVRLSRLNIISTAIDSITEYFPDADYETVQREYLDWLTWLGGEKH